MLRHRFSTFILSLLLALGSTCLLRAEQEPRASEQTPSADHEQTPSTDQMIPQLPTAGSELPLLAFIGLGILGGGVISAMRTRPVK